MNYVRCIHNLGNEASLTIGVVYRTLAVTEIEQASGVLRVIDNEGEDYLYPDEWFEKDVEQDSINGVSELLTIHISPASKVAIRDLANVQGSSMSALVRTWINERLDMPTSG